MIDTTAIEATWNDTSIELEAKADKKETSTNVIVLAGSGISIKVEHGALIINHGSTHLPRTDKKTTLNKAVHNTQSIIIISETGYITLDAMNWCLKQGISVVMLSNG